MTLSYAALISKNKQAVNLLKAEAKNISDESIARLSEQNRFFLKPYCDSGRRFLFSNQKYSLFKIILPSSFKKQEARTIKGIF